MGSYLYVTWNVRKGLPLLADPAPRAAALTALEDICAEIGAVAVNVAALPDQVHLLVRMPPDHTVPWIVGRCKRRSTAALLAQFPAIAAAVGRESVWAVGYHARVLAPAELGAVDRYITNGVRRPVLQVAESPRRPGGASTAPPGSPGTMHSD
ncbi:MAG: transposase [Gemmatimonadetes bacterium]|nr:transposase [Gemmatimonadota bacterium]